MKTRRPAVTQQPNEQVTFRSPSAEGAVLHAIALSQKQRQENHGRKTRGRNSCPSSPGNPPLWKTKIAEDPTVVQKNVDRCAENPNHHHRRCPSPTCEEARHRGRDQHRCGSQAQYAKIDNLVNRDRLMVPHPLEYSPGERNEPTYNQRGQQGHIQTLPHGRSHAVVPTCTAVLSHERVDIRDNSQKKAQQRERGYAGKRRSRHLVPGRLHQKDAIDEHLHRMGTGADNQRQGKVQNGTTPPRADPTLLQPIHH